MIIYCLSYAHDIMIWITRSSDLHSDNIIIIINIIVVGIKPLTYLLTTTTTTTTTYLFHWSLHVLFIVFDRVVVYE